MENFHSSLRRQIQKSNTVEQIIREARIIDQMRGGNSFMNVFSENHNIRYSAKQLEYLEKRTSIFLLNLFTNVYQNLGKSKAILSNTRSKSKIYELSTLGTQVDVKILSMAWNTACPPQKDKFCDLEGCIDSCKVGCVLICGHAYHFECFLFKLESRCRYCIEYLISGIETNCKAFHKSLNFSGTQAKDERIDKMDINETSDDTNTSDEGFLLDGNIDLNNVDLLFEKAMNALTNAQFEALVTDQI